MEDNEVKPDLSNIQNSEHQYNSCFVKQELSDSNLINMKTPEILVESKIDIQSEIFEPISDETDPLKIENFSPKSNEKRCIFPYCRIRGTNRLVLLTIGLIYPFLDNLYLFKDSLDE